MSWHAKLFGRAPATPDAAHALLADIEKQGKQYLDEADNGNWVYPACQRKSPDTGAPTSRRSAITRGWKLSAIS
jgi:hypothetical protein